MRKIILPIILIFFGTQLLAQTTDDYIEVLRSVLKTEKKAVIAETMSFTEDEAKVFWPLYNEFNEKAYVIQSKRIEIIKDFAENYENMTDEKADELWLASMKVKQEMMKLNSKYYSKFKKIIPVGKAAKYFQAENKIAALVDFQLADQIPFIETK